MEVWWDESPGSEHALYYAANGHVRNMHELRTWGVVPRDGFHVERHDSSECPRNWELGLRNYE